MTNKYAKVEHDLVEAVLIYEAGNQPDDLIEVTDLTGDANVGFTWDGTKFTAPPKPAMTEKQARSLRNRLLKGTDYMGLTDFTATPEQLQYRQDLRDIPDQVGFPDAVVWPVKPL
jgi:hypothetical protein